MTLTFFHRAASPRRILSCGLLAAICTLSACGGTDTMSRTNPNFFTADIKDGKLTGQYNPAGFDQQTVRQLLGANCGGGKLASYGETEAEGLVVFTATCAGGMTAAGGSMEFQKDAAGKVVTEGTTYDADGNVSYKRG